MHQQRTLFQSTYFSGKTQANVKIRKYIADRTSYDIGDIHSISFATIDGVTGFAYMHKDESGFCPIDNIDPADLVIELSGGVALR